MAIGSENPIRNSSFDTLNRTEEAHNFVNELREMDLSEGNVVALTGPWGSGKTSFINLMRESFESDPGFPVLDFNPWLFSGTEQLIESFFVEIAAELRIKAPRFQAIAEKLDKYGQLFSSLSFIPVIGTFFDSFGKSAKALNKYQEDRKKGVGARRKELSEALREISTPLIVVIDDIDRLETKEVREIFKLVRLTASFPNVVYLLAFDRKRVEEALSESGVPGRDYLEKIVQISVEIPSLPRQSIFRELTKSLDEAFSSLGEIKPFNQAEWQDTLPEIILPLIKNIRDVKRYVAATRITVSALKGKIDLGDILGLEAIRIFMPDVMAAISQARTALTRTASFYGSHEYEKEESVNLIKSMLESSERNTKVTENTIFRLFPAGSRHLQAGGSSYGADWQGIWLRGRKVAHIEVLNLYLERVLSNKLATFNYAEKAFSLLADEKAFSSYMNEIGNDKREDVIGALEIWEGEYPADSIGPAITVLLNLLPTLPERNTGNIYSLNPYTTVTRVVIRMLKTISTNDAEEAIEDCWERVESIGSRLKLIQIASYRQDSEKQLTSSDFTNNYKIKLSLELKEASTAELSRERNLLHVVAAIKDWGRIETEDLASIRDDAELIATILESAVSEVLSQGLNNRAIHKEYRLHWESLIKVFESEEGLHMAAEKIATRTHKSEVLKKALELVEKYKSGWRPKEFDQEDD